jgi:hypothetical protein
MDQVRVHGRRPQRRRALSHAASGNGREAFDPTFDAFSARPARRVRFVNVFTSGSPLRSRGTLNKRDVVCNTYANMPVF